MPKCVACLQGFDWECLWFGKCDTGAAVTFSPSVSKARKVSNPEEDTEEEINDEGFADNDEAITIREQDDSSLKDQQSTGRKRAAKMYPLDPEASCEFQGKKSCGGGNHPIVGCLYGKQQARHHGPDKNTLNNGPTNVHRICHECHNRWHAKNDPDYVWGSLYPPHAPELATNDELIKNQLYWMSKNVAKAMD